MSKKPNRIVVGLFWGDEGKAKIVDFLTKDAEVVIRYQGGANAGHSVEVDGKRFILHQVPTGILHPGKICVLGAGMAIDLPELVEELKNLEKCGIEWRGRLFVSPRAHLVLRFHKDIEKFQEKDVNIGTTLRGIGPAYADKARRIGIRICDVEQNPMAMHLIVGKWAEKCNLYELIKYEGGISEMVDKLINAFCFLGDSISEKSAFIDEIARTSGGVLAEGAQGTMLSLNWGTYPFVTSSETTAGGAAEGIGIDLRLFDEVIGVAKAFCTRVGNGPFPTEADEQTQQILRGTGEHGYDEFGSTTGRPRRCGWFDGVILKYACRINGVDWIALTKLDVLSEIDPIKIATKYKDCEDVPASSSKLNNVIPEYEDFPGWNKQICGARSIEELPENAKRYISTIESISGRKVKYIGTGPGRDDIICLE